MDLDLDAPMFYVDAHWFAREETAASIARRLQKHLDTLSSLHDTLSKWDVGFNEWHAYDTVRADLPTVISSNPSWNDDERPDVTEGYDVGAVTTDSRFSFTMTGRVGRKFLAPDVNDMRLQTRLGVWPDMSVISYPLFRAIMLAMIACWEPLLSSAAPTSLIPLMTDRWFPESWMTYIHPSLVHRVETSAIPIVEATPDGGLLLSATREILDPTTSEHLEGARRIARATKMLNDIIPPPQYVEPPAYPSS